MVKKRVHEGKSRGLRRKKWKGLPSSCYHWDISFLHDLCLCIIPLRIQIPKGNKVFKEPGLSKNCNGQN